VNLSAHTPKSCRIEFETGFSFRILLTGSPQVIEALLLSTFVSWKAFFPLVRDDPKCTYTFITGEEE